MSLKYKTNDTFITHRMKVIELCTARFGIEHGVRYNPTTDTQIDNHGNWETDLYTYRITFRYEKDLIMFLLMASHLADPPKQRNWWQREP